MVPMPRLRLPMILSALSVLLVSLWMAGRAAAADQDRLFWVLDAEALGGYSKIEGTSGIGTSLNEWLVSPTLKLKDDLYWINVYSGSYDRSAQVVAQEEGGRQSQSTQNHSLNTALKWNLTKSWSLRPLFFADWVFVNETKDESFGNGLYDYRDIGGGVESAWVTLETREQKDDVRLGFRYLNRQYPNYQSLLSLFNPNGAAETNEKDLNGYKLNVAGESFSKHGWSWSLEGIFFYKDYTDKKTIDSNGILTGDGRQDYLGYVNASLSRPLNGSWTMRVDGQFGINSSNLDFYDTHNTLTLADDTLVKNYFDWVSFTVTPSLVYSRTLSEGRDLSLTASYVFYALHYPGRPFQNSSGAYQNNDQQDYTHTFSGKAKYPITKNWSWVSFLSYTIADSNQEFEQFYLYSYARWVAATGVAVKF
jgi:hypothetical protein